MEHNRFKIRFANGQMLNLYDSNKCFLVMNSIFTTSSTETPSSGTTPYFDLKSLVLSIIVQIKNFILVVSHGAGRVLKDGKWRNGCMGKRTWNAGFCEG